MTMTDGLPSGATVSDDTIVDLGNGETATVAELKQGHMRQADYTRKTQELADQRKLAERGTTLLNALDQNPQEAIELIARTYGVQVPSAAPAARPAVDEFGVPVEQPTVDPASAELQGQVRQLSGQVLSLQQQQQRDALLGEVRRLEAEHGEAFDRQAVLTHMQANGISSVETAWRDLVFEERNAAYLEAQQRSQEQQQVLEQKRGLVGVVQGAGVASGAVEQPTKDYSEGSFREVLRSALADTKQELGIESLMDPQLLGT